jgi:recombination protein RecA
MQTARAHLESLLKARKLDVTLTSASPLGAPSVVRPAAGGAQRSAAALADDLAVTGVPALDAALGGGLPRGHLSEIVGGRSSGRTSVMCRALAAAAARDELVALVDTCDRFDPESAAAVGLDLSRLLWIRETGDATRALKAMNLVLQAGGFGLVVLDLSDVALRTVRALPFTTWFRLARVVEGSPTVALLVAVEHVARSAGGATIAMDPARPDTPAARPGQARARWTGHSDRARLLQGLAAEPRIVGTRR